MKNKICDTIGWVLCEASFRLDAFITYHEIVLDSHKGRWGESVSGALYSLGCHFYNVRG